MKPTKEQIIAEANRRRAEHGEGAPPVEHFIVDVVCENWTPPEPVDPDLLAFREWAKRSILKHISGRDVDAGKFDDVLDAHAYLAGARMATEREQERANHPIAFAVRVMAGVFNDLDQVKHEAGKALAKSQGGE